MKRIAITTFILGIGASFPIYAGESISVPSQKQIETHTEVYVPGMGEIMAATQMRHAKLWFAGAANNWELSAYELDEIEEGLDDAVKFHPVFKKGAPIAAILEKFTTQPLRDLRLAIAAKDSVMFNQAFSRLSGACNACHEAAGQGFIVIKQPDVSPFSNQEFAVKSH